MAVTKTAKLNLAKQANRDANWHTGLDQGFDDADARFQKTGAGDPEAGAVTADFIGQPYYDTTADKWWTANATGAPPGKWTEDNLGSSINGTTSIVQDNNVPFQVKEAGGTARHLASMSAGDVINIGNTVNPITIGADARANAKINDGADHVIVTQSDYGTGNGIDADKLDGVEGVDYLGWAAGKYFESGELALPSGGTVVTAHGLGAKPRMYEAYLKCTTNDAGWIAGDELTLTSHRGANERHVAVLADATNITLLRDSQGYRIAHKTTFADTAMVNASWRIIVRAWK